MSNGPWIPSNGPLATDPYHRTPTTICESTKPTKGKCMCVPLQRHSFCRFHALIWLSTYLETVTTTHLAFRSNHTLLESQWVDHQHLTPRDSPASGCDLHAGRCANRSSVGLACVTDVPHPACRNMGGLRRPVQHRTCAVRRHLLAAEHHVRAISISHMHPAQSQINVSTRKSGEKRKAHETRRCAGDGQ